MNAVVFAFGMLSGAFVTALFCAFASGLGYEPIGGIPVALITLFALAVGAFSGAKK